MFRKKFLSILSIILLLSISNCNCDTTGASADSVSTVSASNSNETTIAPNVSVMASNETTSASNETTIASNVTVMASNETASNLTTTVSISVSTTTPASETADEPSSAPDNTLANVDLTVVLIFTTLYPSMSIKQVANLSADANVYIPFLSNITSSTWQDNCQLANNLFNIMGNLMLNGDNGTLVTLDRMIPLLGCLDICDFTAITGENSDTIYGLNASFPSAIIKYLPASIVDSCVGITFQTFANTDASTVLSNIDSIALFDPDAFWDFTPEDSLNIAQKLTSNGAQLSDELIEAIGANIPEETPLDNITSLANAVPLSCFDVTTDTVLVNFLASNSESLDDTRKAYIVGSIIDSANKESIELLLSSITDQDIIDSIPSYLLTELNINTSLIPASRIPDSYLYDLAEQKLSSAGCISNISDTDALSKVAVGLNEDALTCITSDSVRRDTIVRLMSAVVSKGVDLNTYQKSFLLSGLLNSLASITGSTDPATYLKNLTTSECQSVYQLFLSANSTVINAFAALKDFDTVLTKVADLQSSKCCSYLRVSLRAFASAAIKAKFNYTQLSAADLEKLGPCLYANMPTDYLKALDPSVFIKKFSTLGNVFQPTVSQITEITNLISKYASNNTLTPSVSTLMFTTLDDLALFFPISNYSANLTTRSWTTGGSALIDKISKARDPEVSSNDQCQLGLDQADLDQFTSLLGTFQAALIDKVFPTEKRATASYSCDNLKKVGKGVIGLSTTQIGSINSTEFGKCENSLGSITTWSTDKLASLATRAKLSYNVASLTEKNINSLNSIMQGFTSTELATLNLTSVNALNTLGALSKWTTDQINSFQTPLTNFIRRSLNNNLTSRFLSSAGNLLCSIPTSYLSQSFVSENNFKLSLGAFSKINIVCPNVANWYSYARNTTIFKTKSKRAVTPALTTSQLSQMGALAAGISIADLQTLPRSYMSSISSLAFQNMPAATVNALSTDQLNGLSATQVSALQNSPYYSSFSSTIKSGLTTLSQNLAASAKSNAFGITYNFVIISACLLYSISFKL